MIRWALFSTLATGVLYGLYLLLFSRERLLQLRRFYLIGALAFSLLYPLVRLPEAIDVAPAYTATLVAAGPLEVDAGDAEVDAAAHVDWTWWLAAAYLAVAGGMLLVLLSQFTMQAARLHRKPTVVYLDDDTAPYSFLNHIIIGTRGMSDEELQCVLAHEREHVRLGHTLDVLLMRLMCCAAWFNPFAWLMLRELRAVHEFQADTAVQQGKVYLRLLYRQATGTGYGHITNKFNSINIKKRIVMMNKQKSRFGAWKMLAVLPVAAALAMVGCKPAEAQKGDGPTVQEESINVAVNDSVYDVVEVQPEFPGGMEAMYKYMAQNVHYPEQAKKDGIQGRVFVRFVIEADGSVTDAGVLRGIGGGCDEEALRVVNAMPKWKPGMQSDKPVRVHYTMPINFVLRAK